MGVSNEEPQKYTVGQKVGVGTLIAAAALMFPANKAYVEWHDSRYARVQEVLTVAQSELIKANSQKALDTANANSQKLDMVNLQLVSLRVQGAVTVASALQGELAQLEANPVNTDSYRRELAKMRQRVEQATAYRDCLWENRVNCEAIRGY